MRSAANLPSASALAHAALALCAGLLLLTVAQPLRTDDLWWHLALGRAFALHGPWLAEDPLLFAPAGPPTSASWLADVALAGIAHAAGFQPLRALHVASVAAILALAWSELRRASGSRAIASLGTAAFAALAAYRLLQLRPELFTIAATLLCYRWLIAAERASWRRVAGFAVLCALWSNAHAGFPLGLFALGAAAAGLALAGPLRPPEQRSADRARARRLAAAFGIAGLATLVNPNGIRAHLVYFTAGVSTPSLERIADDWSPVRLFALPATSQTSPLAWALAWLLAIGTGWVAARWVLRPDARRDLDPAKLALSLGSLAAMLSAVRFLWLGIFPLLLLAGIAAARPRHARRIAAAACAIAAAFAKLGEPRLVTREAVFDAAYYRRPFAATKQYAHAVWLLADSGVRGNLYDDYTIGGFAGYWLAPDVRSLVNGTLNVSSESLDALAAIAQRRGLQPGEDFAALLDRLGIDLFLGIRVPETRRTAAIGIATAAHLEDTPGWIPIFRNLNSAIYLRANDRNADNLDRLSRYYAGQGVPFDRQRGFEVDAVIRNAPDWAVRHGTIPRRFVHMAQVAAAGRATAAARNRVAAISAVLGRYERAIEIDRALLRAEPDAVPVRRRLVWSLLRLGRFEEASEQAAPLADRPTGDELSAWIAATAREVRTLDPGSARTAIAALAFLTPAEAAALQEGLEPPATRPPR